MLEVDEADVDAVVDAFDERRTSRARTSAAPLAETGDPHPVGGAAGARRRHARPARPLGGDQLPARPLAGRPRLRGRRNGTACASATAPPYRAHLRPRGDAARDAGSGRQDPGRHPARGGLQRRPRDGLRLLRRGLRALGRRHVRPAHRPDQPRALPRRGLRRRLQLRRRARLGQGLGRGRSASTAELWTQFEAFYERPDTFSLGVCNGCQLLALLGWVPWRGIDGRAQPRFIRNASGRFESRFATVTHPTRARPIMLRGMEGSTLGIWVAHGEGQALFPDAGDPRRGAKHRASPPSASSTTRRRSPRPTPSTPTARRRHRRLCARPTAATWP